MYSPRIHIDLESFSAADLPKTGASRYARDPSTEILMIAYAFDDAPVTLWQCHEGPMPDDLRGALTDPAIWKVAFNAPFEMDMIEQVLGIPCDPKQWRCTKVLAHYSSFSGGLKDVAKAIRSTQLKDESGTRLINKFSKPQRVTQKFGERRDWETDPGDWQQFTDYCVQDVEAERAIFKALVKWDLPRHEWDLWALDWEINQRGLPVDRELVEAAIAADDLFREGAMKKARKLTGLDNPNSRDQILGWLSAHGLDLDSLDKDSVQSALEDADGAVEDVLTLRLSLAKTAVKKFFAMQAALCEDNRIRSVLQFYGAPRTGRWGGRLIQPHNPPRGLKDESKITALVDMTKIGALDLIYPDVPDVLSNLVRPAYAAPEGRVLAVVDYASIESVVLAWVAQSEHLLDLFRNGRDPYKDFASKLFGVTYDEVTPKQRTLAKPAVLGGGYGLGAGALQAYGESMGVILTEDEARDHVAKFREEYSDIVSLWSAIDDAARDVINRAVDSATAGKVSFEWDNPFLRMHLPSGRSLAYYRPKVLMRETPWGETRDTITYEGQNQYTRKWERLSTHPGKLVENAVQAIARDVLAHGLIQLSQSGFDISWHVHDEIICEVDEEQARIKLQDMIDLMTSPPAWGVDLPLKAAGFTGKRYRKD
jgi:DNA polymerase